VLFVTLELPKGTRIERTSDRLVEALGWIRSDPAVLDTSAALGTAYPDIFTSRMSRRDGGHLADILVRLRVGHDATTTAPRLRARLADLVGVKVSIEELAYGPPVTHPVLLRIFGADHAELRHIAEDVKRELRAIPAPSTSR